MTGGPLLDTSPRRSTVLFASDPSVLVTRPCRESPESEEGNISLLDPRTGKKR